MINDNTAIYAMLMGTRGMNTLNKIKLPCLSNVFKPAQIIGTEKKKKRELILFCITETRATTENTFFKEDFPFYSTKQLFSYLALLFFLEKSMNIVYSL